MTAVGTDTGNMAYFGDGHRTHVRCGYGHREHTVAYFGDGHMSAVGMDTENMAYFGDGHRTHVRCGDGHREHGLFWGRTQDTWPLRGVDTGHLTAEEADTWSGHVSPIPTYLQWSTFGSFCVINSTHKEVL